MPWVAAAIVSLRAVTAQQRIRCTNLFLRQITHGRPLNPRLIVYGLPMDTWLNHRLSNPGYF